MIQPQDLRINDYVLYEGRIVRIYSITKVFAPIGYECAVYLEYKGLMRVPISALQPIPLTEELLLKCGFKITQNGTIYSNDECFDKLSFDFSNGELSVLHNWSENVLCSVKYLHQLQNMYYIISDGTEIEIKL